MMTILLPLLLSLPQGKKSPFPASRNLPQETTLGCLEIVAPKKLAQHAKEIVQLSILSNDDFSTALGWFVGSTVDRLWLLAMKKELGEVFNAFDRGITISVLMEKRENGRMNPRGVSFVGQAGKASMLKGKAQLLLEILRGERDGNDKKLVAYVEKLASRNKQELEAVEEPLADSPVLFRHFKLKQEEHQHYWTSPALAFAFKGRSAAFYADAHDLNSSALKTARGQLADLLGLGDRKRGGRELGRPLQLQEGESLLARIVIRMGQFFTKESIGERALKEVKAMGFLGLIGAQGFLVHGKDGIHEQYEIHDKAEEGSFFKLFKANPQSLAEHARYLREDSLAALTIGIDAEALTRYIYNVAKVMNRDEDSAIPFIHAIRGIFGLPFDDSKRPGLKGFDSLTCFVVPPAAGAVIPEPGVLLRVPKSEGEEKTLLVRLGKLFKEVGMSHVEDFEKLLRTYGKGEEQVHYIKFKDILEKRQNFFMDTNKMLSMAFGGGFFSVTRVGPYLAIGCNPKSLKRLKKDIAAGKVLANDAQFAATFKNAPGRLLETWVNLPKVLVSSGLFTALAPMTFLFAHMAGPDGQPIVPKFPSLKAITKVLRPESVIAERTDYGISLRHDGGTALSPIVWTAVASFDYWLDILARLAQ